MEQRGDIKSLGRAPAGLVYEIQIAVKKWRPGAP